MEHKYIYILSFSETPVSQGVLQRTDWTCEYLMFETKIAPSFFREGMQIRNLGNAPILLLRSDPVFDYWDAESNTESFLVVLDKENCKKLEVSDIQKMLEGGWEFRN